METFLNILELIPKEFQVMFTAAMPIIELKGAIPVGISFGMAPSSAFVYSYIGSILPAPIILLSIRQIFNYLKKMSFSEKIINRLTRKSLGKAKNVKKYGPLGLFIFVAIPLPGTGVWTGSLIASLLNIKSKRALPAIIIGNLIAGIIVVGISNGVFRILVPGTVNIL